MRRVSEFMGFKLQWHEDGVTINELFSIRLSHLPRNLRRIEPALNRHPIATIAALASWFFTPVAKAGCPLLQGSYSSQYFTHDSGDGFLAVRYSDAYYDTPSLNNRCNFTLADQQPGLYEQLVCLCDAHYSSGGGGWQSQNISQEMGFDSGYKVVLYGQNISQEWLQCVQTFLEANCDTSEDTVSSWVTLSLFSAAILLCCVSAAIRYSDTNEEAKSSSRCRSLRRSVNDCLGFISSCFFSLASDPEIELESKYHRLGHEEEKGSLPHPSPQSPLSIRIASALISGPSAYGTSAIKGSQFYVGLMRLGISRDQPNPMIGFLLLPLIPFGIHVVLNDRENKKRLEKIASMTSFREVIAHEWRKRPISTFLTVIAAATEGLMVMSSVLTLMDKNDPPFVALAAFFGFANTLKFMLLEGKELRDRLKEDFFYSGEDYTKYLERSHWGKAGAARFKVHCVPTAGALLLTALAFIEIRALVEQLTPNSNGSYREDIGDVLGLPFALVYGGIQYGIHGIRMQKEVAEWLISEKSLLRLLRQTFCDRGKALRYLALSGALIESLAVFAASVAFYEAWSGKEAPQWSGESAFPALLAPLLIFTGSIGFFQNYWVVGQEFLNPNLNNNRDKAKKSSKTHRYQLLEFLRDLGRIAVFTSSRVAFRKYLMPNAAAQDETDASLLLSHLFSSVAGLATWGVFEYYSAKPSVFHVRMKPLDDKKGKKPESHSFDTKHLSPGPLSLTEDMSRRSSVSSMCSEPGKLDIEQRNKYEDHKYLEAQADLAFRRAPARLTAQLFSQLIFPMLLGAVLEGLLRWLFTNHGHLDEEESLDNALVLSSLLAMPIGIMISEGIDSLLGCSDRRLLKKLEQQDKEQEKKDEKDEQSARTTLPPQDELKHESKNESKEESHQEQKESHKQPAVLEHKSPPSEQPLRRKKVSMAQGFEGYDLNTFCELMDEIKSKGKVPEEKMKIMDVLKISDSFDQKGSTRHPHCELHSLKKEEQKNKGDTLDPIKAELKKLVKNEEKQILLLPYYYNKMSSSSGEDIIIREEYGFLYIVKEETGTLILTGYNPSDNTDIPNILDNFLSKLKPDLKLQWQWMEETRTPVARKDTGPWVIMQMQALLSGKSKLSSTQPHYLDREINFSQVRLSQFSFLVTSQRQPQLTPTQPTGVNHAPTS